MKNYSSYDSRLGDRASSASLRFSNVLGLRNILLYDLLARLLFMKVSSLLSPVCPPGQVEESILLVSPAFFMAPSSNLLTVNMSHLRECFTYWHRSCAAKTPDGELVPDGASDLERHLAVFVLTETFENR